MEERAEHIILAAVTVRTNWKTFIFLNKLSVMLSFKKANMFGAEKGSQQVFSGGTTKMSRSYSTSMTSKIIQKCLESSLNAFVVGVTPKISIRLQ